MFLFISLCSLSNSHSSLDMMFSKLEDHLVIHRRLIRQCCFNFLVAESSQPDSEQINDKLDADDDEKEVQIDNAMSPTREEPVEELIREHCPVPTDVLFKIESHNR